MLDDIEELPDRVREELQINWLRVQSVASATRLWERCFTSEEQRRLGGDLEQAFRQGGAVGMWRRLHGCSLVRATIEVAHALNFLDDGSKRWLLRQSGEFSDDPDEAIQLALRRADLVVVASPRSIYWLGREIPIDWTRRTALWDYFLTLCEQAKAGLPVDASDFGEHRDQNDHRKQKSRLSRHEFFPIDLAARIVSGRGGQQVLEIEPQRICILERIRSDRLCERT
jgi:hypothetical protein